MRSSHTLDQLHICFDDTHAVANAGLLLPATLAERLGIEQTADALIDLGERPGAAHPGRKLLRAFTFGHVRQLDRLAETALTRAWTAGAGPGDGPITMDLDSTACEVHGHHKQSAAYGYTHTQGAAYGYTHTLGYHPLLATRAGTGKVLHARQRTGRATPPAAPPASSTSSPDGSAAPARPAS